MQRNIIASIFLALICGQIAWGQRVSSPKSRGQSTAAIKVYPALGKRIRIVSGTKGALVDLTDDVSGCLYLFDSYPPKRVSRPPLGIKVIDKVRKDDMYYLVLLTSANSNCNVQGHCGTTIDHTLIWLKLGASLKLEKKLSAIILGCRVYIHPIEPDYDTEEPAIKLVSGKLTIEYGNTLDDDVRTISQLVYDRNFPEQGFVITTKEKKPQQEQ